MILQLAPARIITRQISCDPSKTIRSKNAGVDKITFDIIFTERASYERVKRARVLTRETVANLYGISPDRISDFVEFDPANAIKFTIYRLEPSGSPGDPDIFGSRQYAPLLDLEVPEDRIHSSIGNEPYFLGKPYHACLQQNGSRLGLYASSGRLAATS